MCLNIERHLREHCSEVLQCRVDACRCSSAFFNEERTALRQKRQKMRLLQQGKMSDVSNCKDLPEEIPLRLNIGTKVTGEMRGRVSSVRYHRQRRWLFALLVGLQRDSAASTTACSRDRSTQWTPALPPTASPLTAAASEHTLCLITKSWWESEFINWKVDGMDGRELSLRTTSTVLSFRATSPTRPCPSQPSPRSSGRCATCRTCRFRPEDPTRPPPPPSFWCGRQAIRLEAVSALHNRLSRLI